MCLTLHNLTHYASAVLQTPDHAALQHDEQHDGLRHLGLGAAHVDGQSARLGLLVRQRSHDDVTLGLLVTVGAHAVDVTRQGDVAIERWLRQAVAAHEDDTGAKRWHHQAQRACM